MQELSPLNDEMKSIQEYAEKSLIECEKMLSKEIARVSKFTYEDYDELLKMIFENCGDISELDSYIEYLKQNVIKNENIKERMNNQKQITKKDIIDENIFNIYGIYNATILVTYLASSNPMEFIKNFIILSLIGTLSFKINLDYFTSDYRKKQIADYLTKLDLSIDSDRYNITILKQFKKMCLKELKYEIIKLYEIVTKSKNREIEYKRIDELLNGIDIAYLVKDNNIRRKKK